ncbi:hypothetical protein [Roseateles sp. LYH14W]|uniref:PEP-CTERM sorting domain-containing protein n=1 Tax=Pelomonas parva TaxID=3299032 RepID=A0ABW7EWU5_9BURK
MNSLRLAASALSLSAALAPQAAMADAAAPTLPLGQPDLSNLYGLELNQWYVFANFNTAGTVVDGVVTQQGGFKAFPAGADLSRSAETSQAAGAKLAAASARVSPTGVGTMASARDTLNPLGTGAAAIGYSTVTYAAYLEQDTSFQFDIKLTGQLSRLGDRPAGADTSGAAVAALTYGSHANYTTEAAVATFNAAGLDPYAEGDALIQQYRSLTSSTQTHLDAFGAQTSAADSTIAVDTTLRVTAQGTRQNCDTPFSPACGRYLYFFNVVLFTGAQNGGLADFSHSLEVSSVSVGGDAALPFSAISPVPEPAQAALLIAGLLAVCAARRR